MSSSLLSLAPRAAGLHTWSSEQIVCPGLQQVLVLCAWPPGGLWELVGLCGGITRPCDTFGVSCVLRFVLDLPAEVLIHVRLWNCSRALDGCATRVVMEKALQLRWRLSKSCQELLPLTEWLLHCCTWPGQLLFAIAVCTGPDALEDQSHQAAPAREHGFHSCQQQGGEPEGQGCVLRGRGSQERGHCTRLAEHTQQRMCGQQGKEGGEGESRETGQRVRVKRQEEAERERSCWEEWGCAVTHVDARGVEGTVVGRNGCTGVQGQCGAVAAPDQVRAPAVHREGEGQRQPHAACGGQQAVQQRDAQQGPVLQAARIRVGWQELGETFGQGT